VDEPARPRVLRGGDENGLIVAPGWRVGGTSSATVVEGRLVYAKEGVLRVRRIRDGVDRPLLKLGAGHAHVLAGSFGIAVVDSPANTIDVHRIAWKTIDQTLPA